MYIIYIQYLSIYLCSHEASQLILLGWDLFPNDPMAQGRMVPSSVEWLVHETSEFRDDEIYYRRYVLGSITHMDINPQYYVFQVDYVLGSLTYNQQPTVLFLLTAQMDIQRTLKTGDRPKLETHQPPTNSPNDKGNAKFQWVIYNDNWEAYHSYNWENYDNWTI